MSVVTLNPLSTQKPSSGSLAELRNHLVQLIGEPFRFLRVSYGDELRFHFGDVLSARSKRFGNLTHGSYVLGVRASLWILKSPSGSVIHSGGFDGNLEEAERHLTTEEKKQLEANPMIAPESCVLSAIPNFNEPGETISLQLKFSDGSSLAVMPPPIATGESGNADLVYVADWELFSPGGLLSVGPGLSWKIETNRKAAAGASG